MAMLMRLLYSEISRRALNAGDAVAANGAALRHIVAWEHLMELVAGKPIVCIREMIMPLSLGAAAGVLLDQHVQLIMMKSCMPPSRQPTLRLIERQFDEV